MSKQTAEARLADLKHFRLKEQQELALAKQKTSLYLEDLDSSIIELERQLNATQTQYG